ncbi:MAG TPA: hypothetical protein VGM81_12410 [Burkholderiaceae bacterium]|jgi:hypothetical protein
MCLQLHHPRAHRLPDGDEGQFNRMHQVYLRTGGLASGDSLAYRLRARCDQPISMLARWVVNRSVVAFEWRAALRIPLFQFSEDITVLQPAVTAVMRELTDVLSDWEIANWFAAPNTWLLDQPPCEAIRGDPADVVGAARAARYVAHG